MDMRCAISADDKPSENTLALLGIEKSYGHELVSRINSCMLGGGRRHSGSMPTDDNNADKDLDRK